MKWSDPRLNLLRYADINVTVIIISIISKAHI